MQLFCLHLRVQGDRFPVHLLSVSVSLLSIPFSSSPSFPLFLAPSLFLARFPYPFSPICPFLSSSLSLSLSLDYTRSIYSSRSTPRSLSNYGLTFMLAWRKENGFVYSPNTRIVFPASSLSLSFPFSFLSSTFYLRPQFFTPVARRDAYFALSLRHYFEREIKDPHLDMIRIHFDNIKPDKNRKASIYRNWYGSIDVDTILYRYK